MDHLKGSVVALDPIPTTTITSLFFIPTGKKVPRSSVAKDVLDSMHKDAGDNAESKDKKGEFLLRVDGGATANNLLMQIQV
ncbi:hypothetical protein FRX31_007031 [Thalictrum thalictroides]|uniref:Glycerol kinase n=1 Tax=Thalictrum thalictroides TaxID=46969 RepID=A0A7J6X119_THATH|nr:hypothetical protein FRX31_007031 [Thalictrum thalictroides]